MNDQIKKQYQFQAKQDRTVGLIGLIAFVAIGVVVLLLRGMPFGMIAVGALVLIGGAIGYGAWDRERRRADAYKRHADELMRSSDPDV